MSVWEFFLVQEKEEHEREREREREVKAHWKNHVIRPFRQACIDIGITDQIPTQLL